MKTTIDVTSRREAEDLRAGLDDPIIRASVVIAGVLKQLPNDRVRQRVLAFVTDKLTDQSAAEN